MNPYQSPRCEPEPRSGLAQEYKMLLTCWTLPVMGVATATWYAMNSWWNGLPYTKADQDFVFNLFAWPTLLGQALMWMFLLRLLPWSRERDAATHPENER